MRGVRRVTTRNATFQQWQALLTNRTKRHRANEFVVQGVRPITLAVRTGQDVRALLFDADRAPSAWAEELLAGAPGERFAVAPELLRELGDKDEQAPELLAVVGTPPDDLDRIAIDASFLGVLLDRPTSPGNIGAVLRSADAFGAAGVIVVGHAADPYDPRAVRASTGSLFAVPVVRRASAHDVLDRLAAVPLRPTLVATDEKGTVDLPDHDLTGPTLLLVGNETTGLSAGWREAGDVTVRIPMLGSASSLNAANAAGIALYEAVRQRSGRR